MGRQDDEGSMMLKEEENNNIIEDKKAGWLKSKFSFVKNKVSSVAEDSYEYIGIDKKMEWVKSQASVAAETASSTKSKILSRYSEIEFKEKYRPYLEKAILTVAVAAASEALNDEEMMLKIYELFIDFVPTPLRVLIKNTKADKFIFGLLWTMRGDLIERVESYRIQISSSENSDDEIKKISTTIDNEIAELPNDDIPNDRSS